MNVYIKRILADIKTIKQQIACLIAHDCECQNSNPPTPTIDQNNKVVNVVLSSDSEGTSIEQLVLVINDTEGFTVDEDENYIFTLTLEDESTHQFLFNLAKGDWGSGGTLVTTNDFTQVIQPISIITTGTTDDPTADNGVDIVTANLKTLAVFNQHLEFTDSLVEPNTSTLSIKQTLLDNLIKVDTLPDYLNDNNVVLAQPAVLTPGRIPYTTNDYTIQNSARLLWNNTNSNMEINGNLPLIKLKENLNNNFVTIGNASFGSGSLLFKNQLNKILLNIYNPSLAIDNPRLAIGNVSVIPTESQLYVYGGTNGANIDMRGSVTVDEANTDWEGNNWEISPNSIGISYFGSEGTSAGTVLGYTKNKLGVLRWGDTNNAIIVSNSNTGVVPIRFGINDTEIANLNDKGLEYQSDFSTDNVANPRWLTDKAYVDTTIQDTIDETIYNQVSSAGTLALTTDGSINYFTFTGTTTTWTTPPIASNTKKRVVIINQGSGNITLDSNLGANDLWESGVLVNSVTLIPGQTVSIYNNGINWTILN